MIFKSDVRLGKRYRDSFTKLEGIATAVTFYVHACERVTLEYLKEGEVKYESFDAPRLVQIDTDAQLTTERTGGPGGREARPNRVASR